MSINLTEEFLPLTLGDEGGEFDSIPEIFLSCGIAGAALMDLSIRSKIDSDLQAVWAVDRSPAGDAVLDRVLAEIAAEPARLDAKAWIERLSKQAMEYRVAVLFSDDIPEPHDIALTAHADACFVFERILMAKKLVRRIKATERRTVVAGLAGNVMEWFDFGVYGFFAEMIGRQFFPRTIPRFRCSPRSASCRRVHRLADGRAPLRPYRRPAGPPRRGLASYFSKPSMKLTMRSSVAESCATRR